jgi:tripartite-type tricarboxylate transporter receptor subunit TctC
MRISRRKSLQMAAGAVALPTASRIAWAQAYPSRPITIVVGFAAGGPADTLARILAERLKPLLGQPVLIENVTGANDSIAVGRVVRAAPPRSREERHEYGTAIDGRSGPSSRDSRASLLPR